MTRLLSRQFEVPVSLTDAWHSLARVTDWPSWASHIRRVTVAPAGEVGPESSGRIYLRNGIQSTFRMHEFHPGKNWLWVGRFLWLTIRYDHQFEAIAPRRTQMTWIVDAEGLGVSVLGRLFARVYAKSLDVAIPQLVASIGRKNRSDYGS